MGFELSGESDLKGPALSVVIPCYNEQGNIKALIEEAREVVGRQPSIEFIFVDNGSTDKTGELLEVLADNTPNFKIAVVGNNRGYGFGIKSGLNDASGEFVGWTHADRQTKLTDVEFALGVLKMKKGEILLKGRRFGRPLFDSIFTVGMSLFESMLFRTSLWDINAQPTLFSREMLKEISDGPDDFSLDLFTYVMAKRKRAEIVRFPVTFGARFSGESKWNTTASARCNFIRRTLAFSVKLAFAKRGTQ